MYTDRHTLSLHAALPIYNRASVERTLGRPSCEAQFNSNEWYYVARDTRQLAFSMPKAVDQTILRIRFDSSGTVSDVDKMGLAHVAKISPAGDTTPTLGRDRGRYQEIFSNIGAGAEGGAGPGPSGHGPNGPAGRSAR